MARPPLPNQSVRLSSVGFNKLYAEVRNDPAAAKVIADFIEADPRGALAHVFKLTKRQQAVIEKTADHELLKRAHPLLTALRSEAPGALRFEPHPERKAHTTTGGGGENTETCTCAFHVPFVAKKPSRPPHGKRGSVA
jgi:hypothetical protein